MTRLDSTFATALAFAGDFRSRTWELVPPLLLSYLLRMVTSCCVTGSQYSRSSFHCSCVTQEWKGTYREGAKIAAGPQQPKLWQSRGHVWSLTWITKRAAEHPSRYSWPPNLLENSTQPSFFTSIFTLLVLFTPQTYSERRRRAGRLFNSLIY